MMTNEAQACMPLSGIRVIELGIMITAPLAGMMLGDLGADVIKVERPDGGDAFRSFRAGHISPHFTAFNRNKRSVIIDLQTPEGRDALSKLLADADVLIDNFRPGVMERLGFGPAAIAERFPRLVSCSISGFGETGPYKDRPAFDTVGQALSGILGLAADPEAPRMVGTTISDNVTGMYACYGVMAALFERMRTGKGRRITVNMLEASAAFMPDAFLNYTMMGLVNDPYMRVAISQCFALRCGDGKLVAVHLSSPDKFWQALCRAIGRSEWIGDDRFKDRTLRIANYKLLTEMLNEVFGTKSRDTWEPILTAHDLPFAPIHLTPDVLADPQVVALELFKMLDLPDGRSVPMVQAPLRMDGERLSAWAPAPAYGAHTDEVLKGNS